MLIEYWWENHKERDHYEDQDVGGWITIKRSQRDRIGCYGLD
jgi:hypothetical protein